MLSDIRNHLMGPTLLHDPMNWHHQQQVESQQSTIQGLLIVQDAEES